MKLLKETNGGGLVISFAEPVQLEGNESARFREELRAAADEGCTQIVLDLAEVDFIDSTGLGSLISTLKKLRSSGGELRLARASEAVLGVFEITRLDRVFHTYESVEDAVAAGCPGEER